MFLLSLINQLLRDCVTQFPSWQMNSFVNSFFKHLLRELNPPAHVHFGVSIVVKQMGVCIFPFFSVFLEICPPLPKINKLQLTILCCYRDLTSAIRTIFATLSLVPHKVSLVEIGRVCCPNP